MGFHVSLGKCNPLNHVALGDEDVHFTYAGYIRRSIAQGYVEQQACDSRKGSLEKLP